MRKNFRTLLLKESPSFQPFSSNIISTCQKKKPSPYTILNYSKSKENSYDSNPLTINNFHKKSQNIKPKCMIYKNCLEYSEINRQFPLINNNKTINNSKNRLFNSFNDFLFSPKIRTKLVKKDKIKKNTFNKNNLLLNSIEVNKNEFPKYIFLSKIFKINQSKSRKDFLNINIAKPNQKSKSYKIKNNEGYENYIKRRVKLSYNYNFESSFVHKIKSAYMIQKLNRQYPVKFDNEIENEFKDEDEEITQEKKDIVYDNLINNEKIFGKIKNVLFNQNKKYVIGKETKKFYESIENKINFLYDIYVVPNFKNNLLKKEGITFQKKLEDDNYIEFNTWRYLNISKIRLQKLKDETNFSDYILYEDEEINKENKDTANSDEKNIDIDNNKKFEDKYESFENEDYLSKKKENQSIVNIIDEKTKKFFYGTFLKIHNKN